MSCCGKARAAFAGMPAPPLPEPQARSRHAGDIEFEYAGWTGLTVRGPVTGALYRFSRTGSRVFVRGKDSAALAAVPQLRRVPR